MSALIKHVEYFDFNEDGKIMPWETYEGFRRLGYNRIISLLAIVLINGTMSYSTQESWIPDPLFSIIIKNINYCKHGSDTGIYDHEGEMDENRLNQVFKNFNKNNRLGLREIFNLTNYHRVVFDLYGYVAAKLEWGLSYLLVMDQGYLTKEDLRKIIDGSIFYEKDIYSVKKEQK